MNWEPASKIPPLTSNGSFRENRDLVVWVEDANTFAAGACVEYAPGDVTFRAVGYNGEWNITHWMAISRP